MTDTDTSATRPYLDIANAILRMAGPGVLLLPESVPQHDDHAEMPDKESRKRHCSAAGIESKVNAKESTHATADEKTADPRIVYVRIHVRGVQICDTDLQTLVSDVKKTEPSRIGWRTDGTVGLGCTFHIRINNVGIWSDPSPIVASTLSVVFGKYPSANVTTTNYYKGAHTQRICDMFAIP